jgi:hypothetical protein
MWRGGSLEDWGNLGCGRTMEEISVEETNGYVVIKFVPTNQIGILGR